VFLDLLRDAGVRGIGLDIDPQVVQQALAKNHEAHVATDLEIAAHAKGADGIHISHVIEHLWGEQMLALLENSSRCLAEGGLLVVRTPNWRNKSVSGGGFWDDYTHKRPYNLEQLERILEDLGMRVTAKGTEPYGWEDLYIISRKEPLPNADTGGDLPIWPKLPDQPQPSLVERIWKRCGRWARLRDWIR
jgi:SAM-dependent methyltransferase